MNAVTNLHRSTVGSRRQFIGLPVIMLLLVANIMAAGQLQAQPDFKASAARLSPDKLVHPYLLFNDAEKKDMLKRIAGSREQSEIFEKIQWEGRKYLYAPPQTTVPQKEIHTRFYGSDDYRTYQNYNANGAVTLAFLYQMTGDERYAQKSYEYAEKLAELDSWINRAHYFEIIYPRVWPYNVKDDQVVFSFDITSSGYAQKIALVYDWICNALNKYQRDRLRNCLLEKAIIQVRGNWEYHWWATAYKCNWSGICHSGLGVCALALLKEDPRLTDVVARSYEGVWNMLDNIEENGGWQEGRGYWAYGIGSSMVFMEALKRLTGGRDNMFMHNKLRNYPVDFGLYGMTAGFCDGGSGPVGSSYFINKLITETGSGIAAYYRKEFIKSSDDIFDLIWPVPDVMPAEPKEYSKHFAGIDWAVMRKNFIPENITIACKAGMNDDPHHGHLDCGTFTLTWKDTPFIGEITRAGYDEQYFGDLRWTYPQAGSKGHNVVMVNGEEQVHAKYKDQPWKEGVGGKILEFRSEKNWDYVIMDPTNAYPGNELKNWIRWIILDKENNMAIVLDKINCRKDSEIEVRFHPGTGFLLNKHNVVLKNEDAEMEMIPFGNINFNLKAGRLPKAAIRKTDQVEWHNFYSLNAISESEDNFIGNAFIPVTGKPAGAELKTAGMKKQIVIKAGDKITTFQVSLDGVTRNNK